MTMPIVHCCMQPTTSVTAQGLTFTQRAIFRLPLHGVHGCVGRCCRLCCLRLTLLLEGVHGCEQLVICGPPLRGLWWFPPTRLRGRARTLPAIAPRPAVVRAKQGRLLHRESTVTGLVKSVSKSSSRASYLWPPSILVTPLTSRSSFLDSRPRRSHCRCGFLFGTLVERQDVRWVHVVQALPLFDQLFRVREKETDCGAPARRQFELPCCCFPMAIRIASSAWSRPTFDWSWSPPCLRVVSSTSLRLARSRRRRAG